MDNFDIICLSETKLDQIYEPNINLERYKAIYFFFFFFFFFFFSRFNKNHFLQIAGTAMGTRVAPTYANIFMSDFENRHVYTYDKQPLLWVRFIDDIFLVWTHGESELNKFITHLNSVHNTIKFTSEFSSKKVNFLDTWAIIHSDGTIKSDLYTKPTDSNNYLTYDLAHPPHCKRGFPSGQFLRLRRICSDDDSFIKHSIVKGKHFIRRG